MSKIEEFFELDVVKTAIQEGAPLEVVYEAWDEYTGQNFLAYKLTQYFQEKNINPMLYLQKTLPNYCFTSLKAKTIEVPSNITMIGDYAFAYMPNLESVVLPTTIKSIGQYAFYEVDKEFYIYYQGTQAQFDANVQTTSDFKRAVWKNDIKLICTDMID